MINGHCLEEFKMTSHYDPQLSFRELFELKEKYVQLLCRRFKNKYARILENKDWEIILIAESKISEIITQDNILKIA